MKLFHSVRNFIRSRLVYKFCLAFFCIITSLGFFIFWGIDSITTKTIYNQHEHSGLVVTSHLTTDVVDLLLVDNISQILLLLNQTKEDNGEIAYIFIVDKNQHVLAHTFQGGFPDDLMKLNQDPDNHENSIQLIDTELGFLQDISAPILNGSLGRLHVGFSTQIIDMRLKTIRGRILFICIVAAMSAILLAVFFSRRITKPLGELSDIATAMADGVLDQKISVQNIDEVGKLANSFEHMRNSIQETIHSLELEIGEREQAEEEKNKIEAQLRQSQKMEAIGTMAGGIAHDFNNILAIIIGNADMSKYQLADNDPVRNNIDRILYASTRAKELIRQILSFSRQKKGKKEPYYLCRLVDESVRSFRSTIPASVEVKINIPVKCRENITGCNVVLADPTEIHQLLINLCVNAIQAMDEEGVLEVGIDEVTFTGDIPSNRMGLYPGTYEHLFVTDTGEGVNPEIAEQIFDPFFTTKEVGKGTGMGLAVVHGIVDGHGGKIFVENKPGEGATFHIYFPISEKQVERKEDEIDSLPRGDERILFVDDEELLADLGKKIGEMLGYSVTAKTDSIEALELFKKDPERFDLIITDQTMPNLTGLDIARQILQIKPNLPIILCTGFSSKVNKEKAQEIGIRAFAAKPLDYKEIAELIRQVLDEEVE